MTVFNFDFVLLDDEYDPLDISNAIFDAGFEDSLIGTGVFGHVSVELCVKSPDKNFIKNTTQELIQCLPSSSMLHRIEISDDACKDELLNK